MCITDGILRARLDGELTQRESLAVDDHLTGCADCRGRLDAMAGRAERLRSEEHTSELQSPMYLVCRLLLEKKNQLRITATRYEDVRAFVDKLLRRGKANAAIAASNECDFSFKLAHVFLLSCRSLSLFCCLC